MRVVFMGTPRFAVPSLQELAAHHEVIAAFTKADAASGRGKTLLPSEVKQAAQELGIPVHTPTSLRSAEAVELVASLAPDVICVAAYGMILPAEILDIPRFGCINVHGSLLPRWRGAAPIQRAILAGDSSVGVCIMRMETGLDTGAFCLSYETHVADKNTDQLTDELADAGARLLLEALDGLEADSLSWIEQGDEGITYAERIAKAEVRLAPELSAADNLRRVHASSDAAPARAIICGRGVAVMEAHLADATLAAGEVSLEGKCVVLGCDDGALVVDTVKPDGKRAMEASAWRAGLHDVPLSWEAVS